MVANKFHYRWDFIGLSTDTKPTPADSEKVVNGSTFYCSDTSKLYVFYKDTWYERKALGGGGGGGTSDYEDLSNLPKINNVELKGNKTANDLNLVDKDDIGELTNLTTTTKNNIVSAINEVDGDVGDKSTLKTTAKTNLVSAVNENFDKNTSQQNEIDYAINNGVKNISLRTLSSSGSINGITYTLNEDGSYTLNGTATANSYLRFHTSKLATGNYILTGCPSGGSLTTYYIQFRQDPSGSYGSKEDFGNGVSFSVNDNATYIAYIAIMSGVTFDNVTFKPMIRDARIIDDTYTQPVDTGWMTLPFDTTKWTGGTVKLRRKNGVGFLTVEGGKPVEDIAGGTFILIGTMPVGYRPASGGNLFGVIWLRTSNGSIPAELVADAVNGSIYVKPYTAVTASSVNTSYGSATFPV